MILTDNRSDASSNAEIEDSSVKSADFPTESEADGQSFKKIADFVPAESLTGSEEDAKFDAESPMVEPAELPTEPETESSAFDGAQCDARSQNAASENDAEGEDPPCGSGAVVLEVEGIGKIYKKYRAGKARDFYALKDVSFQVRAGEVVGFLGPNGAGKTTAIKLITGLASLSAGSVRILGHDVKRERKIALSEVGGVIESPDMYPHMTAEELLNFFAGLIPDDRFAEAGDPSEPLKVKKARRIESLLRAVGLENRKNDKIKTYSMGMKQRLGIAQALVGKPKLLLLDEPSNGLDPAGIKEIRTIVKGLAKQHGMAVLVSSHQLSEMEQTCDRVIILYRGEKTAEGTVEELTARLTKHRVRIKTTEARRAAALFAGRESTVVATERDGVLLSGRITAGDAAKELVLNGVPFTGIGEDNGTLEDLYFRITRDGGARS